jgi:hypothetical protein
MNKITYVPNTIKRVLIVKLIKKLLGFLAPTFYHNTKRRDMAFDLYDRVKDFERELLRCVPMNELADASGNVWADLHKRQLPDWLVDALYSTLTYDPDKTVKCSTMCGFKGDPTPPVDDGVIRVGDIVRITYKVYDEQPKDSLQKVTGVREGVPYPIYCGNVMCYAKCEVEKVTNGA